MALQTEVQWKEFFRTASISDDATSTTYAKAFFDNGFSELSLPQLDRDTLTAVGVTSIGHQLAILQHIKNGQSGSTTTPTHNSVTKASVSAKLSTLTHEMTKPQFRKFMQDWLVYKQITHLQPNEGTPHLYNACDEAVQTELINTHRNFRSFDEDTALKAIESVVTIRANPAGHCKEFGGMIQGETGSVKAFVVRLRSAANDCAFQCPNCEYDLSDVNIRRQLIRGLSNPTLQAEILTKANQLKTLDEIIGHAETFETALRDQSTLSSSNNNNERTDNVFGIHHNNNNNNNNNNNGNNNNNNNNIWDP